MVEQDGRCRTRPGLCVVINGNLKQRELTISFFICSPRGSVLSFSHLREEAESISDTRAYLWWGRKVRKREGKERKKGGKDEKRGKGCKKGKGERGKVCSALEDTKRETRGVSPRNMKRYVPWNSITIRRYSLAEAPDEMRYCGWIMHESRCDSPPWPVASAILILLPPSP